MKDFRTLKVLSYLADDQYNNLQGNLVEVRKMLNAFIQRLKSTR